MFTINRDQNNIVHIKLDRPEVHNAFNDELIDGLIHLFEEEINPDSSIRLVTLSGVGKSFCAGADLNWMKKMVDYSEEENKEDSLLLNKMFETMDSCPHPMLAKVQGAALGGGVGLVAVCDYAISEKNTVFGFTEVQLGLIPAVISPYIMSKIGAANCRAYFLSGSKFNAERAMQLNLIHEVVEFNDLDSRFEKLCFEFLKAAPAASKIAKLLIGENLRASSWTDLIDTTTSLIAERRISKEGQEGMKSLLEKRKPLWQK